ncbi:pancreatic polypeptide prohormone-like [Myotis daubentonii]|uniref:pancreatic polypeptide prohormone-like n=1 Tax=Myotis daubentonii TaxID=98922 RepID=UPI002873249B|nr:pancreatic polypeptide prohormone-like [Myotis daubentonii]
MHPAGGRHPLGPGLTCSGLRMAAARRCLSLLFLSTCVALLLQPPPLGASEDTVKPVIPGEEATPEEVAQYVTEFRRYIDKLTRSRCEKRDQEETLRNFLEWGAPNKVAPRELSQMDV